MIGSIEIPYKCKCYSHEISMTVAQRRQSQDILEWMEYLTRVLALDHHQRSPICKRAEMEYIKIPFDEEGDQLGTRRTRQ